MLMDWEVRSLRRPERGEGDVLREKNIIARNLHRRVVASEVELAEILRRNGRLEHGNESLRDTVLSLKEGEKSIMSACLKFTAKLRTRVFGDGVEVDQQGMIKELEEVEKLFSTNELTPNTRIAIKKIHDEAEKENNRPAHSSSAVPEKTPLSTSEPQKVKDDRSSFKVIGYMNKTPSSNAMSSGMNEAKRKSPSLVICEKQIESLRKQLHSMTSLYEKSESLLQESTKECVELRKSADEITLKSSTDTLISDKRLAALKKDVESRDLALNDNAKKAQDLEGSLSKTCTDLLVAEKQNTSLQSANSRLKDDNRNLAMNLQAAEESTERLNEEKQCLTSRLLECECDLEGLMKTITEQKAELSEKQRQLLVGEDALRHVKQETDSHVAELVSASRELSRLQEDAKVWVEKRDTLTKANQDLALTLQHVRKDLKEAESSHRAEVAILQEKETNTRVLYEDKERECRGALVTIAELKDKLQETEREAKDARDYHEKQTVMALEGGREAREKQKRQVELLRNQLGHSEARIAELERDHDGVVQQLREERDRCDQIQSRAAAKADALVSAREAEICSLQQQLDVSCSTQAELSGKISEARIVEDRMRIAMLETTQELSSLKRQFDDLEITTQGRGAKIAELENQCKDQSARLASKDDELRAAMARDRHSCNSVAALTAELDLLTVQKEQESTQLRTLSSQSEEKDRIIVELEAGARHAEVCVRRDRDLVAKLEAALASKDDEINGLQARIMELESRALSLQMSLNESDTDLRRRVDDERDRTVSQLKHQLREGKRALREAQNKLLEAELRRDAAVEVADKFLRVEQERQRSPPTVMHAGGGGAAAAAAGGGAGGAVAVPGGDGGASPSTPAVEKEVLRRAFCSFLSATSREDFTDRARLLCSMLEFPATDVALVLSHLQKFEPSLLAMSVFKFDPLSVDLSSRFENLLFSGGGGGSSGSSSDGGNGGDDTAASIDIDRK
jgi:chromosome segregation ATPase